MAEQLMKQLIAKKKAGTTNKSVERLLNMCNVYYAAEELSDSQYQELVMEIKSIIE